MTRYLIIVILLCFTVSASAQVIIEFVPEVSGRSVDGLFQCRIINSGRSQSAVLTITVTERTKGTVCIVKTPSFNVVQGANTVPVSAARSSAIQFSNNKIGQLTRSNRQFAEGDYDYCFNIKLSQSDLPEEQCFSYLLAPFAELSLIEPYDKEKISEIRPLFSWQPLIPGILGSYYQLVVSEVKAGQNPTEALNYNLPVVNQSGIVSPALPYPSIARELQRGKKYAWQVTVYKDQTILNRSEIWDFTVEDRLDSVKVAVDNGYRDLEELANSNYYVAVGVLKFAMVNPYADQKLAYEIVSLNKPDKKINHLPSVKIQKGGNKIIIDLSEMKAFKDGEYYIIKVWLPNGSTQNLKFLYKEAE